jgi:hypothetical protein
MKIAALQILLILLLAIPTIVSADTPIRYIGTAEIVKALYLNLETAQNANRMAYILAMAKRAGINALVIDIRSTGGPLMFGNDTKTKQFLAHLHAEHIYAIARIVVFKGGPSGWYDPADRRRWQQVAEVSRRAIALGFDEINYDYVRYGSVNEPHSSTPISQRTAIIRSFFEFLKAEVRDKTGRPISVDIFGWAFLEPQRAIGQRVEDAIANFDYVMPMVYPSHWGRGNLGIPIPGREPYQTVYRSLTRGWERLKDNPQRIAKLRVWIQAFDLESINPLRRMRYGPKEITDQVRACYDAGCTGWALWNAANIYEESSLRQAASLKP